MPLPDESMSPHRIFLLSPANCGGLRARMVLRPGATFDLARRVRARGGAPLGEVFSFMSGLYFRGKLAYARAFAEPPSGLPGVLVITTNEGLVEADEPITARRLRGYATGDIDAENPAYRRPLLRDARRLARGVTDGCEIVLLGSVASGKYVDVLEQACGERLRFPLEFVGRGDMSRGGLMLRCAAARRELTYVPLAGAMRHGPRPPRLDAATRVRADAATKVSAVPLSVTWIGGEGSSMRVDVAIEAPTRGEGVATAVLRAPVPPTRGSRLATSPAASVRGTRRSPPRRAPTSRS